MSGFQVSTSPGKHLQCLGMYRGSGSPSCQGGQSPSVFGFDMSLFSPLVGLCARSSSPTPPSGLCELSQGLYVSEIRVSVTGPCPFSSHNFCLAPSQPTQLSTSNGCQCLCLRLLCCPAERAGPYVGFSPDDLRASGHHSCLSPRSKSYSQLLLFKVSPRPPQD